MPKKGMLGSTYLTAPPDTAPPHVQSASPSPPRRLTTKQACQYLEDVHAMPRSQRRMAQYRFLGNGPEYQRDGVRPLYRTDALDAWAEAKLGKPVRSTSEESARRQSNIQRVRLNDDDLSRM